jgi:hypothetical protein
MRFIDFRYGAITAAGEFVSMPSLITDVPWRKMSRPGNAEFWFWQPDRKLHVEIQSPLGSTDGTKQTWD